MTISSYSGIFTAGDLLKLFDFGVSDLFSIHVTSLDLCLQCNKFLLVFVYDGRHIVAIIYKCCS